MERDVNLISLLDRSVPAEDGPARHDHVATAKSDFEVHLRTGQAGHTDVSGGEAIASVASPSGDTRDTDDIVWQNPDDQPEHIEAPRKTAVDLNAPHEADADIPLLRHGDDLISLPQHERAKPQHSPMTALVHGLSYRASAHQCIETGVQMSGRAIAADDMQRVANHSDGPDRRTEQADLSSDLTGDLAPSGTKPNAAGPDVPARQDFDPKRAPSLKHDTPKGGDLANGATVHQTSSHNQTVPSANGDQMDLTVRVAAVAKGTSGPFQASVTPGMAQPAPTLVTVDTGANGKRANTDDAPSQKPGKDPVAGDANRSAKPINMQMAPAQFKPPVALSMAPGDASFSIETQGQATELTWDTRAAAPQNAPTGLAQLQRTELPPHVAQSIADAMKRAPDKPIEITLRPVELGRVRMTMSPQDTGMTVLITAERTETLDLMRRNIDDLSRALSDLGFEDVSFTFEQGDRQPNEPEGGPSTDMQSREPDTDGDHVDSRPATGGLPVSTKTTNGIDMRL